jgi:hypothetical protein
MNAFNISRSWVNRRVLEDNRLEDKISWQNAARSVSFRSASTHTSLAPFVPTSTPYSTSSPRKVVRPRVYISRVAIRGQARYQIYHPRSYKWTSQPECLRRPHPELPRRRFNLPLRGQRLYEAPAPSNAVIVSNYRGAYFDLVALVLGRSRGIGHTTRRVLEKTVAATGFARRCGTCESSDRDRGNLCEQTEKVRSGVHANVSAESD